MVHYIYKIVNKINNKCYIGYTSKQDPSERWKVHINASNTVERPLYFAMGKYGKENFEFTIIYCSKDADHTLKEMETYFIKEYETYITSGKGYNLTLGGESNFGWVPSDETKKIWSAQRTGKKATESQKQAMRERMLKRYEDNPELREYYRQLALERGIRPPKPTLESMKKGAITRTGLHIHSTDTKEKLSKMMENSTHNFCDPSLMEKRRETWKQMGRNTGSKNVNATFADVYAPSGELVGSGYLRDICEQNNWPFNKFSAASRHGNPLERGEWKKWKIIQIPRPV